MFLHAALGAVEMTSYVDSASTLPLERMTRRRRRFERWRD